MFSICVSQAKRRRDSIRAHSEWLERVHFTDLNRGVMDAIKMAMDTCADDYIRGVTPAKQKFFEWNKLRNSIIRRRLPRELNYEEAELMRNLCCGLFIQNPQVEAIVESLVRDYWRATTQ